VAEIASEGINRQTTDAVLARITALYRDMAEAHRQSMEKKGIV